MPSTNTEMLKQNFGMNAIILLYIRIGPLRFAFDDRLVVIFEVRDVMQQQQQQQQLCIMSCSSVHHYYRGESELCDTQRMAFGSDDMNFGDACVTDKVHFVCMLVSNKCRTSICNASRLINKLITTNIYNFFYEKSLLKLSCYTGNDGIAAQAST